ncbi:MAG: hypothetical protein ACYTHJ_17090 [Planctomycetota bacterium]|jgi:hypothetical protein
MQKANLNYRIWISGLGAWVVLSAMTGPRQTARGQAVGQPAELQPQLQREVTARVDANRGVEITAVRAIPTGILHRQSRGLEAVLPDGGMGGVAGGMECICDLDCADGDPCTADTCDETGVCQSSTIDAFGRLCDDGDGEFCTNGTCDDSGNCVGDQGGDPCDVDEVCNEVDDQCDGTECTDDSECSANDDPDNCLAGVCDNGRCGTDSTCLAGEACDGAGTCDLVTDGRCCSDLDNCSLTALADCDGGNGPWSQIWDCDCPKYSAGENQNDGAVFNFLLTANEAPCDNFSRVGDDYAIANGSFLEMTQFRFVGGPTLDGTGNGTMVFEIWDGEPALANPVLVAAFAVSFTGLCEGGDNDGGTCLTNADCPNGACNTTAVIRGSRFWTITLGTPTAIPPIGYFAVRPGIGSGETVGILSTNDVGLIGSNDQDVLFFNDAAVGPFLSPDFPDILAIELIGNKIEDPTGSCCFGEGACQDDSTVNTEWLCDDAGGTFVAGLTCLDAPCDEATCCQDDGSCSVTSASDCVNGGGEVGIFGGNCDLNCCPQPETGSNTCGGGTPTLLDTASTSLPIVARFSGDNSQATNGTCSGSGNPCRTFQDSSVGEDCPIGETCDPNPDECTISTQDQGWWESFTITSNANVEIGYCCTDPASPAAPGFRWIVLADDCTECTTVFRDADGDPPVTGCADGQPADIYSGLTAGTYYYSIFGERYCQNSATATDCIVDSDCAEGEGPCITQTGPYELQITATALPDQACCLSDVCIDTVDSIECEAMGGFTVPDTPLCIPINPCTRGACCLGAGECIDSDGNGITRVECELNPTGQYIGGARCADDPCPVCEIEDDANCQYDTGIYIVVNDRALSDAGGVNRWVDDFRATGGGPLDRICWWPAFFNPDQGSECSAPGEPPPDLWNLRVYADAGGLPGPEIGLEQALVPDAKVSLGATSRVWQYSAPVDAPPVLTADQCYWIEITGEGEGEGGCTVYATLSDDGNHYVVNDTDGIFGPEDVVTQVGTAPVSFAVDVAMCVSVGMAMDGCGDFVGACCQCNGTCSDGLTVTECLDAEGFFFPGQDCGDVECPDANIPGDNCVDPFVLTHPDDDPALDIPFAFDNRCANTDGPPNPNNACAETGTTPMVNDLWYAYTPPCCGTMTASMCPLDGGSADFDMQLAVYNDSTDSCTCPTDTSTLVACNDSGCGIPGGPSIAELEVEQGSCYLLRVGGTPQTGTGAGVVSIECGVCKNFSFPPLADDRFDVNLTVKPCTTDADCKAGETGPDPQTVCRDTTGDGTPNACYVAKQRYLSIKTDNPPSAGISRAYRVSLDTGVAGSTVLGFNSAVDPTAVTGPGVSVFNIARIVDTPVYDTWEDLIPPYLHFGDCEISTGNNYLIQAIPEGQDTGDEGNYSDPLELPTPADNGDVTGGGNPGDPPNGATGSLVDVFSQIKAFQATQNENKDWLDFEPQVPNMVHSLADAFQGILAFQLNPYPFAAPLDCP